MHEEERKLLPSDINADEEYDDDAIKKYLMKQAIYEKRDLSKFSQLPHNHYHLKRSDKMWHESIKKSFSRK